MTITINVNIIITYTSALFVFIHSYKFRGLYKTLLLFLGAVIVGGGLENINTIFGGYYYPGSELTLFIGECPFDVILGWYVIIYCTSYFSHALIGNFKESYYIFGIGTKPEAINKNLIKNEVLRAALAGYLAVNLDFLIDPVAVHNKWWIWLVDNIYVLGVPVGNYIGWWFLIFWTLLIYDLILNYSGIKELSTKITSGLWSIGTIISSLLTGFILLGFTIWFAMKGVRTEGLDTYPLDASITPQRVEGIIIAAIMIISAIALIMLSSLFEDKLPEPRPEKYIWKVLPSIIMLIFWGIIMVVAVISGPIFVAIGILYCVPYLAICIYFLFRPPDIK
ncbi:MAG: carotenoid biosynthesis protein [Promethearchaeota archaeon]